MRFLYTTLKSYTQPAVFVTIIGLCAIVLSGTITCYGASAESKISIFSNLEDDSAAWGVYLEGSPTVNKDTVEPPSLDGNALRCAITGGVPYSNLHCYRNLPPEPEATVFVLTLSFQYTPVTTFNNQGVPSIVQALEFTMNTWNQFQRYEFVLQWQNVGDGAPQWRYWDPHHPDNWVAMDMPGTLDVNQWHTLQLEGEIIDGNVHYSRFTLNEESYPLNKTIAPIAAPGEADRLAIAFQLDGTFEQAPYEVFLDAVHFVVSYK